MSDEVNPFDAGYGIHGPATEQGIHGAPVGNDAMVAAPMGIAQADHLGEFARAQQNGMTTLSKHDVELALSHAENVVKDLQARGATREQVLAAVGHYANGNPDLAAIINDAAGKQYDANKNPFASPQGEDKGAQAFTLASVLGAAATEKYVLDDHERPIDPETGKMMSTTASIAALEQFRPQAGLPVPQRQQGLQRG